MWARDNLYGDYEASLILRPSPSLQLSLTPAIELNRDEAFYVHSFADSSATATFGKRYVFTTLNQRTASLSARADWTLTPTLSFQLFAQPLHSNPRFAAYKTLRTPASYLFDAYQNDDSDPSFEVSSLRANAVARWEFRTGSAVYLVWQQTRAGDESPARNILLAKASYRLGR